jgi:hypothetical protein
MIRTTADEPICGPLRRPPLRGRRPGTRVARVPLGAAFTLCFASSRARGLAVPEPSGPPSSLPV